jgi:hypothetical protein
MKHIFLFLAFIITVANVSYSQGKRAADYNYEVQFIRTGLQGTELFKVYTYGKSEKECFELAKEDAVRAIIFKGIPGSGSGYAMLTEAGGEDKHRAYFDEFFGSRGKYLNFVAISNDGSIGEDDRLRVGKKFKIGVIVSVQKAALRKELEAAGIVKKLDQGF